MGVLRIRQDKISENRYRVTVAVEGDGEARQTAESEFDFELTPTDNERIRWYLEEYLQYPHDPAPTIAAGVEKQIEEIGTKLFNEVFGSRDALKLWARVQDKLNDTRVEIATTVEGAVEIPWELMRDPDTGAVLSLRSPAFVRTHLQPGQVVHVPKESDGAIRILLVICRPGKEDDVPFRSVASRLIKGLREDDRELFQLEVLRPATFERLGKVLREAKANGRPYHVVHFDGHGTYIKTPDLSKAPKLYNRLKELMVSPLREGSHAYLAFESGEAEDKAELVDGPTLGNLLVETEVGALVLNACKSAHADLRTEPKTSTAGEEDPHEKVRALGSLALEVMDVGVAGVVAMRYNVFVVTAAEFVANLYGALSRGRTLGEAVTMGRKQLAAHPKRTIAFDPRPLQDWCVPVIYEAAPIRLFPLREDEGEVKIELKGIGETAAEELGMDAGLPRTPDAGFFGRDGTLLALDRAFDKHSIVLLHAYAGSGKTATAAEFARWYALTGGLGGGPVLFTTFERHTPLRGVLGHFGEVFGAMLEQAGVNWSAKTDTKQMRDIALWVLTKIPVLWIWDNVEPVNGFPAGTKSAWSKTEQKELVDFLRDGQGTKARFLLTSRRDERKWLGDELPRRITIPPMPMQERVQLARGLAERQGRRLAEVEDWLTLLTFTQGNPLTITVLVGQALRDGLRSKEQIAEFVEKLRRGEKKFRDEKKEGRSKSLGASLDYGFGNAFSEEEQKKLALLHFFQGFVDVDGLRLMGSEEKDWGLAELRNLSREAGMELFDRAAEVGLVMAHGGGYYSIHPALPWFFKELFDKYYPGGGEREARAFAEAVGELGNYCYREYEDGKRELIGVIKAEEGNLLYARQLAREHGWWDAVTSVMQGLRALYGHTGMRGEWRRLVVEIVPEFVDAKTDGPFPGREEEWSLITQYRVWIAIEERQWAKAERLQRVRIKWDRKQAKAAMAKLAEELDREERNRIRTLGTSLHDLAQIQRDQGKSECVGTYEEAMELVERIGDQAAAAICAFNLGHVYKNLAELRDLDKAEEWYQRGLELRDEGDRQGRSRFLGQLGNVAWERLKDARKAKRPDEELLEYLNEALGRYHEALKILPEDAIGDLAVVHNALGMLYGGAGEVEKAMEHFRKAIGYFEMQGDQYGAGRTRYNVALGLAGAGRFGDALEYAKAALANYESYGDRARADIELTKGMIAEIEEEIKKQNKKE